MWPNSSASTIRIVTTLTGRTAGPSGRCEHVRGIPEDRRRPFMERHLTTVAADTVTAHDRTDGEPMSRILITGTNSGFGKLASLSLARAGHQVVATMRDVAKGDDLRKEAADAGVEIEFRQLDVCDPDSVASALHDGSLTPADLQGWR